MAAVEVLGTGCHNCLELERRLATALARLGRSDLQVKRVDDERVIMRHLPLDAIPGLLIDGRLVSQREVPEVETLVEWLGSIPMPAKS